jgi:1-acyl-sn-glycerol-3-phosphate acyltransferase
MLYTICRNILWVVFRLIYRIEVRGSENIPSIEGALICPNHFCWADPLLIAVCMKRRVMFMAKHETFKIKLFAFFLKAFGAYPIKRGEADLAAFKTTLKALKENKLIVLFPEGTRVKGEELGKANAGAPLFSIKSGKPVVPVGISGNYKLFSKFTVSFGKPVEFFRMNDKKLSNDEYLKLGEDIMDEIRLLIRCN